MVIGPLVSDVESGSTTLPLGPDRGPRLDQAAFDAYNCAKRWAYADSDEGVP